jgi:hypothetical protein
VAGGLNEEQAAVDAGVLDVALTLRGKLLSEVGRVLVLDVLDDRVPAAVVVDQVTVTRSIDDVEAKTDAILLDDVGNRVDLGGGSDDLLGLQTTLRLDEVGSEDGVDEGRLSKTSLACDGGKHTKPVSYMLPKSMEYGAMDAPIVGMVGKLTDTDYVELEATLQQLALDLAGDAVETDMALGVDARSRHGRHFRRRDGYRELVGQESNG